MVGDEILQCPHDYVTVDVNEFISEDLQSDLLSTLNNGEEIEQ